MLFDGLVSDLIKKSFLKVFYTSVTLFKESVLHSVGFIETVAQRCSVKKVFLEISQNSQENTFFVRTPLVAASGFKL